MRITNRQTRLTARSALRATFLLASISIPVTGAVAQQRPQIWFGPADNSALASPDLPRMFENPASWANASKYIQGVSLPANWLLRSPPSAIARTLAVLRASHLKLDVSIPAMPVDKKICGYSIEGMIWPGEGAVYAKALKALGAEVDSFSLDLPLTNGHINQQKDACKLTVADAAGRVADVARDLWAIYPQARIVDLEIPTGISVGQWTSLLKEWLVAYRRAAGRNLDALTLDLWWEFPWTEVATKTALLTHKHGVPTGVFIDSDGNGTTPPTAWIADTRRNACALAAARVPIDYVTIANWANMSVPNIPDTSPQSLSGLVVWYGSGMSCSR